jgi:hypothetical protein
VGVSVISRIATWISWIFPDTYTFFEPEIAPVVMLPASGVLSDFFSAFYWILSELILSPSGEEKALLLIIQTSVQ